MTQISHKSAGFGPEVSVPRMKIFHTNEMLFECPCYHYLLTVILRHLLVTTLDVTSIVVKPFALTLTTNACYSLSFKLFGVTLARKTNASYATLFVPMLLHQSLVTPFVP